MLNRRLPVLLHKATAIRIRPFSHHISVRESEKPKKTSVAESLTTKSPFNDFFEDFSQSVMAKSKLTSFEEQKSFEKIFEHLGRQHGDIGITNSLKEFANLKDNDIPEKRRKTKGKFVLSNGNDAALMTELKEQIDNNKKISSALLPTLNYINNTIQTSEELTDFIMKKIIGAFVKNLPEILNLSKDTLGTKTRGLSTNNMPVNDELLSNIKPVNDKLLKSVTEASLKDPSHPEVNTQTLPILLKISLNSLVHDFDRLDEALFLWNFIKSHKCIELYEFGLNVDVFNMMISTIWKKTQNLQMVAKLVSEMQSNAIEPDLFTFKILCKIYLKCMGVRDGIKADPYLMWCDSSNIYKIKDYLASMEV
ncbi:unnamed protein product [Ambrosiozyma monospora]|uniref:Unnamed protein product n=1 Tax=Ambrosiozyma monospora TaxID=43982 RepID=A0ACB5SXJ6_AMBMO|nr:unnamed protein product [Ambrosiozyma monospora]